MGSPGNSGYPCWTASVFHEAGHLLFGVFGWETLTVLGGTLMQLLVPMPVFAVAWGRCHAAGTGLAAYPPVKSAPSPKR